MSAICFESAWFRCYSRALLTDDRSVRPEYVKTALDVIHETLHQGRIKEDERDAISETIRELNLLETDTICANAS